MRIDNPKALFDYTITERFEAGVVLTGSEVKSLRLGHAKLDGSYVKLTESGAQLINAHIYPYSFARIEGYDPKRSRKLLFHKRELVSLQSKIDRSNMTLVPLGWYNKGPHIKLSVGLGKGKKEYEKREKKRRDDEKREIEREWRGKVT